MSVFGAWRFDPLSALIGAALALLAVGLLSIGRRPLQTLRATMAERVARARQRFFLTTELQYRRWLAEQWPRWVAWSALDPRLAQCLIEPAVLPPPPVPRLHLEEPPAETPLSLRRALQAARRLFLYGPPGSGRTSALAWLAQEALAGRLDAESTAGLPVYVRLPLLAVEPMAPPEIPLLDLLKSMVPLILRPRLDVLIRPSLRSGTLLLLLDELDAVPSPRRPELLRWLGRLLEAYPALTVVLAGDGEATRDVEELGFVPLPLAPWTEPAVRAFLERWSQVAGASASAEQPPAWGRTDPLGHRPADVAAAVVLRGGRPGDPTLYDQIVERLLRGIAERTPLTPPAARLLLGQLALQLLEEERFLITLEDLERALARADPDLFGPGNQHRVDQAIEALTAPGRPIVPIDAERGHFRHPLLQAYLAAWALAQSGDGAALLSHLDDPNWEAVLTFYAALGPLGGLIERALTAPDDAFRSRLLRMARWAAAASPQAPWRPQVLAALGRAFLQPGLPPLLRQRLVGALIQTGDPGVPILLHRALRHADPEIRAAAARGLGWLGRTNDLPFLEGALADPHPEVRAAAVRALGDHGAEAAMQRLIRLLLEAEEPLRRLAAEALLAYPEGPQILREATEEADWRVRRAALFALARLPEPWAKACIEQRAREDPEWLVRSAALDALELWEKQRQPPPPDLRPLALEQQGWLIEWAVREGEAVGMGSARQVLQQALERGDVPVRRAALLALARVGDVEALPALRALAFDPDLDPLTRDLAFRALEAVARRTGTRGL